MEGTTQHSDVALLDNRALCDNFFLHPYVYRRNRYAHLYRQHITMRFLLMVARLGIHSLCSAAPATQLPDEMPSSIAAQLKETELKARGILPNGPPPIEISKDGILTLKWMAFNELLEVAFFSELLANVINNVPGFEIRNENDHNLTIRSLTAILEVRIRLVRGDADQLTYTARGGPRAHRQQRTPTSKFTSDQALQVHLSGIQLQRRHQPSHDTYRSRSWNATRRNPALCRRQRHRTRACIRFDDRPKRQTSRLVPDATGQDPQRNALPNNQRSELRLLLRPSIYGPQ